MNLEERKRQLIGELNLRVALLITYVYNNMIIDYLIFISCMILVPLLLVGIINGWERYKTKN